MPARAWLPRYHIARCCVFVMLFKAIQKHREIPVAVLTYELGTNWPLDVDVSCIQLPEVRLFFCW